ncbi:lycopene cyclase domain-containing protein [Leifsonia sp. NPDC058230]|uniref:lycopene cyclase domain-containing protein n=1 Tax=Leifsonia sp. NPDC058230 TaxID=3346391 RepID=UPI0036DACE0E
MTYFVLSLVFLAVAASVLLIALLVAPDRARVVRRWWPGILVSAMAVLVLTAVFDNLMIGSGLMQYDEDNIAGVRLGLVPVEDFAYPVAALLLLPALWLLLRKRAR